MPALISPFTVASILGIAFGLGLLIKGMAGQRRAARIGDTATSTISAIAVGEVRISGVVEPAELVLTSPLQSRDCVYYRAKVSESSGRSERTLLDEERAVGFRVRDASGDVRVFPGAPTGWCPPRSTRRPVSWATSRSGLRPRMGGAIQPGGLDRDAQIAALLTVHRPSDDPDSVEGLLDGHVGSLGLGGQREYEEARIEPGDVVTIVGMVQPFDQLPDPAGADAATGDGLDATGAIGDPEIAGDLAEARAAGLLETDPAEAWGNAAIPGFGIGHPVRAAELDPAASPLPAATAEEADRYEQTFDIKPETLIVAASPDVGLLVSLGAPGAVVAREENRFLVGLLGAILAIVSAVALASALSGGMIL